MSWLDTLKGLTATGPPAEQPNYPTDEKLLDKLEQLRTPLKAIACRREVATAYPDIEWQLWLPRSIWESDGGQPAPDVASASGDMKTIWSEITMCPVPEEAESAELEAMASTASADVTHHLESASGRLESALADGGDPDQAYQVTELARAAYTRVTEKAASPTESTLINSMFEHNWDDDASGEAQEQFGYTIDALAKLKVMTHWLGDSAGAQLAATTMFRLELDAALDDLHGQLGERGEITEIYDAAVSPLGGFSMFIGGLGLMFSGVPWVVNAGGFTAGVVDAFGNWSSEISVEKVAES
ncbi:hypothetical protein [Glycomyces salinus]|uniref:hypothetical protein n=1 Tax=Glycomyces salinus TaxID=980294 RepID=UPI0018EB3CFF|nr:hypothetical protein [Glycomyces salinus]